MSLRLPVAVLVGSLRFGLEVFHGPFTDGSAMADTQGIVNSGLSPCLVYYNWCDRYRTLDESKCIPGSTPDCINAQPKGFPRRSLTQWLGGMGIIMLGLMLLSRVLGGGMALARAELTGPSLFRLRPKLQETPCTLDTIFYSI